jgi:hypothetical protein
VPVSRVASWLVELPAEPGTANLKERSWIAKLAARKLKARSVAIVIGKTIHLHNATREEFMRNHRWVRHELMHIRQYQEEGVLVFLVKYLWESIKSGYLNNKYEVAARLAERDEAVTHGITIL